MMANLLHQAMSPPHHIEHDLFGDSGRRSRPNAVPPPLPVVVPAYDDRDDCDDHAALAEAEETFRRAQKAWEDYGRQIVTEQQIEDADRQLEASQAELQRLRSPDYLRAVDAAARLAQRSRLASLCLLPMLHWWGVSLVLTSIAAIGLAIILIACSVGVIAVLVWIGFVYLGVFGSTAVALYDLEKNDPDEQLAEVSAYLDS
jgi:hypothetical protein